MTAVSGDSLFPRFRDGELVTVVRPIRGGPDDPSVEVGMTGRVELSGPDERHERWVPWVMVDDLADHPDALAGLPIPEDALESRGLVVAVRPDGGFADPAPIDPTEHESSFWRELGLGVYTGITRADTATALADRVLIALRELGVFDRVEISWVERHWHEPHEYRVWFHIGAADAAGAFHRFLALRSRGAFDCDDDGFHAEAEWSAQADPDTSPFLAPEVTHLSIHLSPQRSPRRRARRTPPKSE